MDKSSTLTARILLGSVVVLETGLAALMLTHPNVTPSMLAYWISPLVLAALLVLDFRASGAKLRWVRAASVGWVLLLCGLSVVWIYDALWAALMVFAAIAPLRASQLVASSIALAATRAKRAAT